MTAIIPHILVVSCERGFRYDVPEKNSSEALVVESNTISGLAKLVRQELTGLSLSGMTIGSKATKRSC